MRSLLLKSTLILTILITNAYSCHYYRFDRWIKNDSHQYWSILSETYYQSQTRFIFDGNPARGPKACQGLFSPQAPCILPPGKITYVVFENIHKDSDPRAICRNIEGRLHFSNGSQTVTVNYNKRDDGINMNSNNEPLINDNHGDITISSHQ